MKAQHLLEGCGAAILILLAYLWPQISPSHAALYFSVLPVNTVSRGILIDLIVLTLAWGAITFLVVRKAKDKENSSPAWVVLLTIAVIVTVASVAKVAELRQRVPKPGFLAAGILLLGFAVWRWSPAIYARSISVFRMALVLVGCCIFWMLPKLVFVALHRPAPDTVSFRHLSADPDASSERIVWILLDELSYAQVFEIPHANLNLPALHGLAADSFSFSNLIPPGYYTAKVVPSLILGRQIFELESTLDGQAIIRTEKDSHWHALDPQQTLFGEARRDGWTTGVAGWSNPYCRLLDSVLDSCFWYPDQFTPAYMYSHMSSQKSAVENALAPLSSSFRRLLHEKSKDPSPVDFHVRDAEGVLAPAETLVADKDIRFAFVHMPVPHPPGVYDRGTQQIRNGGSYLDNLALADRDLQALLDSLRSAELDRHTIVIVCSDHSWRIPLWRGAAWWTKEDEQAAKAGFDPRPVLLVHFPAQQQGTTVSQSMNSLVMHDAIAEILHGRISNAAQFSDWLADF